MEKSVVHHIAEMRCTCSSVALPIRSIKKSWSWVTSSDPWRSALPARVGLNVGAHCEKLRKPFPPWRVRFVGGYQSAELARAGLWWTCRDHLWERCQCAGKWAGPCLGSCWPRCSVYGAQGKPHVFHSFLPSPGLKFISISNHSLRTKYSQNRLVHILFNIFVHVCPVRNGYTVRSAHSSK